MTSRWVLWVKLRLVYQYFWINWKEKWTYRGPASDILHDKSALFVQESIRVFIFSDELAAVQECLKKSIILTREEGLSLSRQITDTLLGSDFLDSFKCLMCHSLSQSPVTVRPCCREVLGCNTCIDQWFAGNNRCLHCRAENAQERTIKLNCFLNVLSLSRELFYSWAGFEVD